ncbi:hypothetical protein O181_116883 [Austropuccinia psidii MF-1]|uniref:Uncharacterized protein n=1 Tax=Austropuccinia psidii MF-1 TaxID=1389203 RepID=A0A9Q3K970_9BASI|nr:hypothetical protein [Austropuccinia psidii MF-1]
MLTRPHPPPDETVTLPSHLFPHHSLCFRTPASSSPRPKILTLWRSLKLCLQHCPHPPLCLLEPAAYHPYACGYPPDMPPMLLTILTLTVPSQHACNSAYHPYAHVVPSQHACNAAYHPYAHCSQDETMMPPPSPPSPPPLSSPLLPILTHPQSPQDIPPMPPSTPLMLNPLSTAYHTYTQVLDP